MIDCKENEDGSFTISWDANDPIESVLNDWTEEDFIEVITNYAEEIIAAEKFISKNSKESREEPRETSNISEGLQKDWIDFWEEYDEEFWKEYNSLSKEIDDAKQFLTKDDRLWEG